MRFQYGDRVTLKREDRGATWTGTVTDYRRTTDVTAYLVWWDGVSQSDREWYRDEALDPVEDGKDRA